MTATVKKKRTLQSRLEVKGFLFVLPSLLFFLLFVLVPIIMAVTLAFTRYDGLGEMEFVGFDNFVNIFTLDTVYLKSFANVAWYALFAIPLSVVLPLVYALLINSKVAGGKVFRAIYYLPGLTSAVAAATVFRLVFNPDIGIVNSFLRIFAIEGPQWLESSSTAMITIVILAMWQGIGGNMIIYAAAMKGISPELYEAGKIDGATKPYMFFKITLPLLLPTTFFIITMSIIGAFQLYDQVLTMTDGGPANSTVTPVFVIYNRAFGTNTSMGYASAQAVILFALIAIISTVTQRFVKDRAY
jgi:multiple sugar transport system permease protein